MKKIFFIVVAGVIAFSTLAFAALDKIDVNMYDILSEAGKVRVYVEGAQDLTGETGDMNRELRAKLEDVIATRMTIDFIITKKEEEAALIVGCEVTGFLWLEQASQQEGSFALNPLGALKKDEYARLEATFWVKKGPEGNYLFKWAGKRLRRKKYLWKEKIHTTLTEEGATQEESKALLEYKLIDLFMKRCFSKAAKSIK